MIFAASIDLMFDHNTWPCFFSSALSFGTVIIMGLAGLRSSSQKSCTSFFIRDFYCQLKPNDRDLHIALTKLDPLIFDDTLNTATSNFNLEDSMNEQTSYSNGRNFSEWIRRSSLLTPMNRLSTA
jgi:hypothetical protein